MPLPLDHKGNKNALRIKIRNREESKLFGRDKGERIKCDTGWLLPQMFRDLGLKTKTLDMVYNYMPKAVLPWEDSTQKLHAKLHWPKYMSEWLYKKKLFATHKKDTSRGTLLTDNIAQVWKKRIDIYTQREFGVKL